MEAVPGVQQVAMTPQLPLDADPMQDNSFDIEGRPAPRTPDDVPGAYQRPVTPGYFETMGIPLLRGRAFARGDDARAPLVAVIDSAAMQRYWPNESPIGKRIHYNWGRRRTLTIVGVVGSVKHGRLRLETAPTIYVPLAQFPWNDMTVVARTSLSPGAAADAIARVVHTVDPELPLSNIRTLEGVAAGALWRPRFASVLLGGFALVGLLLSGLGLYGIMSYDVTRRAREIALRFALGARAGDVSMLVLRRSSVLVAIGIAIGVAISFAANRVIAGLLHGVGAVDPGVYGIALLLTAAVAALASAIPARRAAAVAPGEVLRGD
jgi:putative ABC transport system permease protein